MPLEGWLAREPAELLKEEGLPPIVDCVRKRVCVAGLRVFDGIVRMSFVRSGQLSGELCPRLDAYHGALHVLKA